MIKLRYLKIGNAEPVLQYCEQIQSEMYPISTEWQTVELIEEPAPPRHWSDVLDVALDASRDKVEKKYRQKRHYYNGANLNRDKLKTLDRAWGQYLSDTGQRK